MLLVQAQENGQVLDEEHLAFLADSRIPDGQAAQTTILQNVAFQSEDLNAYNSDYDDLTSTKAVLMANLSSCDLDVLSKFRIEPQLMTPGIISLGLVPQHPSSLPNVSPIKDDWDTLFQQMFDEYFNPPPSVDHPVPTVAALKPLIQPVHLPQRQLIKMHHLQVPHELLKKYNLKSFLLELVPRPDRVMIITLKWISKVKLNELGGALKNKARLMTFTYGIKEIAFKTPYKDLERSELSSKGHDLLSSRIILSEDDYDRGCRKPSDLENGIYIDTIKLGPEYMTGIDDEGEVT
nr:hypothetical protein [Tanacetum cinerariifolium]